MSHEKQIIILDGGLGHELKQRGVSDGTFLAGLLANETQPALVEAIHRDYREIGCDVITTNNFVAVPQRMIETGLATDLDSANKRTRELIAAAVRCARAAGTHGTKIAGTIPPLTECYVASAVPEKAKELIPAYKLIITALLDEQVDILLAETISTSREALAIISAVSKLQPRTTGNPPLWLSFTVDDENIPITLRSGEKFEDALISVLKASRAACVNLEALGVNCASPRAVTNAIPTLMSVATSGILSTTPRIIAYGNAFQTTTTEWLRSIESEQCSGTDSGTPIKTGPEYDAEGLMFPDVYAQYAKCWADLGVTVVGGCCGCGPQHMRSVVETLKPQEHHLNKQE